MEDTDTWAAFGSEYLKAIEVEKPTDEYVIVGVESKKEESKTTLVLSLERGELKKIFGCNKTNLYAVQQECPINAKQAIGRIITFNKVQVQNPQTKQTVDGLRLQFKQNDMPKELEDSGVEEDGTM